VAFRSGALQLRNALTAIAAARMLADRGALIDDDAISRRIAATIGRAARAHRRAAIYVDGSHNPRRPRNRRFWEHFSRANIFLIYGAMRDKAVDEIAGLLFPAPPR